MYLKIKEENIPVLINCLFNSAFLDFSLKLEAMCLMQKTEERPSSS